jgi:hypothetical protein
MSTRRVNPATILFRAALVCAWAFAVSTFATLVFVTWIRWPGPGSTSHVMFGGFGLTYVGAGGTVLIIVELVALASAVVLSLLPRRRTRLIGHLLLVAWVALWLGNAINNARLDPGFLRVMLVPLLAIFFLATAIRAVHGFRTGTSPGKAAEADVAA